MFDLGGVVLGRGMWLFREYIHSRYGVSEEEAARVMIRTHYHGYFSGFIGEEEYWSRCLCDLGMTEDWRVLRNILLDFYTPNEGMKALLQTLHDKGYQLVLLSDQTQEWWPLLDSRHSVSGLFDHCIISAQVGLHKPDPQIYELALHTCGANPRECVFIDDLAHNLPAAQELGIRTILFENVDQLKAELTGLSIDIH